MYVCMYECMYVCMYVCMNLSLDFLYAERALHDSLWTIVLQLQGHYLGRHFGDHSFQLRHSLGDHTAVFAIPMNVYDYYLLQVCKDQLVHVCMYVRMYVCKYVCMYV